ncbi:hypothetical protein CV717_26790 [Bacillus cereus]|nr:hypothetical protein CV741_27115 [Bacillus cereus]PWN77639.1 hypothetical protein CV717_26790 [Bacillus cereus]
MPSGYKLKNFIREHLPLFEPMTALTHGATTERHRLKEVIGLIFWDLLPGATERSLIRGTNRIKRVHACGSIPLVPTCLRT